MQGLWNWLITDAGAGWILGLIGLAGALYTWRKRERPTRVVVREIETIRLLDIHPSQHESFTILYPNAQGTQTSITNLRQTSIIVYNTGTRDITEPIQLTFKLHEKDVKEGARGFWKLVVDTPEYTFQPIHGDTTDITKALRLDLPYLNSYDTHKQIIKMYFMSELKITLELVNTNSKGWSAYFVPLRETDKALSRAEVFTVLSYALPSIIALLLGLIMAVHFFPNYKDVDPGIIGIVTLWSPIILVVTSLIVFKKRINVLVFKHHFGVEPSAEFRLLTDEERKSKRSRRIL